MGIMSLSEFTAMALEVENNTFNVTMSAHVN